MPVRGVTKNVAIAPRGTKDLNPEENFIPGQIDLKNGFMTDAGNWSKRPGYAQSHDVGVDKPIEILVPEGSDGYAVSEDGKVYRLTPTAAIDLPAQRLTGASRPTWVKHDAIQILADGGPPVKILAGGSDTALLGGSPSNFKYLTRVGPYVIGAGHDPTQFKWSAAGNPDNWTTGDSGFANVKKDGAIKNGGSLKDRLFFFKDNAIEVWFNRGGTTPFVRIETIEKGMNASDSLVKETDTFYWLGDDLRFYRLDGVRATPISSPYEGFIQGLLNPSEAIGFNFKKEHLLKWLFPTDGVILVFDYKNNIWSEDARWVGSGWQRIPMNSYMEINNKQFIGSFNLDGLIYEWGKDNLDDAGQPIRVFREFSVKPSDKGHKNRFNRLRFRLKRGVATAGVANPLFSWRYRFDRNPVWQPWDDVDMGVVGDNDPYIDRRNLGIGRELSFQVSESDAVDFLLQNMDLTVKELGN